MKEKMTEEQIERRVESYMNAADKALMRGSMTQAEYDKHVKAIHRWADMKLGRRL